MTIVILLIFGALCICGLGESSKVSCLMFLLHMAVLSILILGGLIYGFQDGFKTFRENFNSPFPDVVNSSGVVLSHDNFMGSLFFGYCAALLGITGFETASNYVEEMAEPRVFVGTIDLLW